MKLKLQYLIVDTSRHGTKRLYYRAPHGPKIRIWVATTSPEFLTHYADARKGIAHPPPATIAPGAPKSPIGPDVARPNTFRWLCQQYMTSGDFRQLAIASQARQRAIFESCWREPIKKGSPLTFGDLPLVQMTAAAVRIIRDRKADLPGAANNRIKYLRRLFSWAETDHPKLGNPARKVAPFKTKSTGFHAWTPAEVRQFETHHPIGTRARLALDILLYTCVRRGDVVRLGDGMVDADGWLGFNQGKNQGRVEIPVISFLADSIAAGPAGGTTWLETSFGKPFAATGFGNWFRDQCDAAGLPHCSAHGVRKATAARLAELGCSEEEIQAITGHADPKQIRIYTRSARKRIMAASAMSKLGASVIKARLMPTARS